MGFGGGLGVWRWASGVGSGKGCEGGLFVGWYARGRWAVFCTRGRWGSRREISARKALWTHCGYIVELQKHDIIISFVYCMNRFLILIPWLLQ